MTKIEWIAGIAYIGVLALLPLLGSWTRQGGMRWCAHDGGAINPLYAVRVRDGDGAEYEFCCIACCQAWLRYAPSAPPRLICVTDEVSGTAIDATAAVFVRSLVVTNRTTGNRIHAFASASEAERHTQAVGGQVLGAAEYPFAAP